MRIVQTGSLRAATLAGLCLLLGAVAGRAGIQDRGNGAITGSAASAAADITGTWEARGQPYDPWIFELRAEGNKVTGRVWQNWGASGPVAIAEGRIEGNAVILQYPNPSTSLQRITLTGVLAGNQITFTSQVQIRGLGASNRPVPDDNSSDHGVFGTGIAPQFVVTRGTPSSPPTSSAGGVQGRCARAAPFAMVPGGITVTGSILVEEGRPRPVFQIAFSDAKGEWTSPPQPRGGCATFDPAPNAGAMMQANPPVFAMSLPPGDYKPIIAGLPAGYTVKSIQSDSADLRTQPLKVAAGANPPHFTVTLGVSSGPPWVKVRGRIVNLSSVTTSTAAYAELNRAQLSRPISILLIGAAFSEYFAVPVAADGSFEFPWVLPGTYTVRLPPNIPSWPASLVVGDKDLTNVDITAAP